MSAHAFNLSLTDASMCTVPRAQYSRLQVSCLTQYRLPDNRHSVKRESFVSDAISIA